MTNDEYWDCECEEAYIHSNDAFECAKCGALRDESPDSKQDEVDAGVYFAGEEEA